MFCARNGLRIASQERVQRDAMQIHLPTRRSSTPMTGHPKPSLSSVHPMSWDPNSRGTGWSDPGARYPNVRSAVPTPIPRSPNISRARRYGSRFHAHCRRRLCHHHIPTHWLSRNHGTSGRYFPRHGCGCRDRRFFSTTQQCEWRQRQHPNACSHNSPFCISFVSR